MYKKLIFVPIVCIIIINENLYAQNISYDINKIEKREHLNLFYNKLNKKQEIIKKNRKCIGIAAKTLVPICHVFFLL